MGSAADPPSTRLLVRVLAVASSDEIRRQVRLALDGRQFALREADSPGAAPRLLKTWNPHLVILDVEPGADRLLSRIGRSPLDGGTRIPVLAITRRGDLATKLAAFDQGVDDVLTAPFAPDELVARVSVIVRRSLGRSVAVNPILRLGELEIDLLNRRVRTAGRAVELTAVEQSLLFLLAANAGRALSRDEILDSLWGEEFAAESNVVDRHVKSLRAKLHDNWAWPRFIETVRGIGYRFRSNEK